MVRRRRCSCQPRAGQNARVDVAESRFGGIVTRPGRDPARLWLPHSVLYTAAGKLQRGREARITRRGLTATPVVVTRGSAALCPARGTRKAGSARNRAKRMLFSVLIPFRHAPAARQQPSR
jgi:hypothetical protein